MSNLRKNNNQKACVIVQARMNSTRLPGKVLKEIGGRPLIIFLIERLILCKEVDEIIIATTVNESDDQIVKACRDAKTKIIRGSEKDVLSRYAEASKQTDANILVRITADCPLIDPYILDELLKLFKSNSYDYINNTTPPTYPDGLDIEIFTKDALLKANTYALTAYEREHVTTWMIESGKLDIYSTKSSIDYSSVRLTVDEEVDLIVINEIVNFFKNRIDFSWSEIKLFIDKFPEIIKINQHIKRNEGSTLSSGQKLWKRAKNIIPGGNHLLSKRPEMFLPDKWPTYYSKSSGCFIWDLDGKKFIDMCIMGIGTNVLGYGHPDIDQAVISNIKRGNMSTLNCPEEVYLAEKLVEIHDWSDMARFARTGGEANSIAIRIARAATGKDSIAICGYHGWHDWYLATNLTSKSRLKEHLLAGLDPKGVPNVLRDTVHPFSYNNIDQLKNIIKNNKLAAIKMEVQRDEPPSDGFLESIRSICDKEGIVLIFDECTSGFRETYGGLHLKYKVNPDMAVFGKALGNGYAISAVIGRENIMQSAQETFISSTFWTERVGPTAALKTLEVMEREKSWELITANGEYIKNSWVNLAKDNDLKITTFGIAALAGFRFDSKNALEYKTLISQEMLKKGYLASTLCMSSTSHTKEIINNYINELEYTFKLIKKVENDEISLDSVLDTPVCHTGFNRLN